MELNTVKTREQMKINLQINNTKMKVLETIKTAVSKKKSRLSNSAFHSKMV